MCVCVRGGGEMSVWVKCTCTELDCIKWSLDLSLQYTVPILVHKCEYLDIETFQNLIM